MNCVRPPSLGQEKVSGSLWMRSNRVQIGRRWDERKKQAKKMMRCWPKWKNNCGILVKQRNRKKKVEKERNREIVVNAVTKKGNKVENVITNKRLDKAITREKMNEMEMSRQASRHEDECTRRQRILHHSWPWHVIEQRLKLGQFWNSWSLNYQTYFRTFDVLWGPRRKVKKVEQKHQ